MRCEFTAPRLAFMGAALLFTTACGSSHHGRAESDRVVTVTMTDNSFTPDEFTVTEGETITFEFHNKGKILHEAVFGDAAVQAAHANQMSGASAGHMGQSGESGETGHMGESGEMSHMGQSGQSGETGQSGHMGGSGEMSHMGESGESGHMEGMNHGAGGAAASVGPDRIMTLEYTFSAAGEVLIGCHQPGHWDAGMKAVVHVEP